MIEDPLVLGTDDSDSDEGKDLSKVILNTYDKDRRMSHKTADAPESKLSLNASLPKVQQKGPLLKKDG